MVFNTTKNIPIRANMCVRNDENVNGITVPNALSTVDDFVGFEKYASLYISVISVTHTLKRDCAKGRKKI